MLQLVTNMLHVCFVSSHVSLEDPSNTIWFFPLVPASKIECHAAILHSVAVDVRKYDLSAVEEST
jgi:hypothetical protein